MHLLPPRILLLLPALFALGPEVPLFGQAVEPNGGVQEVAYPAAVEVPRRYRAMADSAARIESEIAALAQVTELEAGVEEARTHLAELRQIVESTEAEYVRPERLSRLRDRALLVEQRLALLAARVAERLQAADEIRIAWMEKGAFWRAWRDALTDEQDRSVAGSELRRATERIQAVIDRITSVLPDIERIQGRLDLLRAETSELSAQIADLRAGRRDALTRRAEPVLFSRAYFTEQPDHEWRPTVAFQRLGRAAFFATNVGLLVLHVTLVLGLAWVARRLRRASVQREVWSGLLNHPWAFSLFAATALLAGRYWLAPALWDVLMWAVLAGSGARLATSLLRTRSVRAVLYLLATLYPLFLLAEALQTPGPLFRLGLAGVALAGFVGFGFALLREMKKAKRDVATVVLLAVGILMWMVVLVASVAGLLVLARWVLHATVTSAYVVFIVVFLMVVARGAVQMLVRVEATGRLSFLRTVGLPVVERVLRLLLIVLAVAAALNVLDIWGLAPTPLETWQRITSIGVTIAGVYITIDRVLLAVLIVYLAFLLSRSARAFARKEVYPRWEMERGVGDSMNALLHYVLIIVAVFIGIATLGVELQNFAILAGALGIGIGFGLQNIVNNFVSGLILLFERPVRVGDVVVIDEEFGTIQKIGLRSTTVLRVDLSEVIVPNADLVSEKVVNWTLSTASARLIVPVGVAYGSNVGRVLELLQEVGAANPLVMSDPMPQVLFIGFGDSSLDFELRVWLEEFTLRLAVRSALLTEITRRFTEEGIEIPFPQRDLHVRSVDQGLLERLKS